MNDIKVSRIHRQFLIVCDSHLQALHGLANMIGFVNAGLIDETGIGQYLNDRLMEQFSPLAVVSKVKSGFISLTRLSGRITVRAMSRR